MSQKHLLARKEYGAQRVKLVGKAIAINCYIKLTVLGNIHKIMLR